MSAYNLIDSFNVDNGELSGFTPTQCFTLGVEWQIFRQKLLTEPRPFKMMIQADNQKRLELLTISHKRKARVVWIHDDFNQWKDIYVK